MQPIEQRQMPVDQDQMVQWFQPIDQRQVPVDQVTECPVNICFTLLSQWEFFPWEIRVAFPKESQRRHSGATQP